MFTGNLLTRVTLCLLNPLVTRRTTSSLSKDFYIVAIQNISGFDIFLRKSIKGNSYKPQVN